MIARDAIAGVVLAGGRATRMGGVDKPLLPLRGQPLLQGILNRLTPQVADVAISANGDSARFAGFERPVLPDDCGGEGGAGPLGGILAGLRWASDLNGRTHLVSVAGDTPFFPGDLVARLAAAAPAAGVAVAASAGRRHPVFALWPVGLAADLAAFLAASHTFSVAAFLDRHAVATVEFAAEATAGLAVDPFLNINTPADLAAAEIAIIRQGA